MKFFRVGGCVRDEILGVRTKDIDFAVEGAENFDALRSFLDDEGFEIFVETPQFLTIRARFPKNSERFAEFGKLTADFAMCRSDGPSSDGRRPDSVSTATLTDDLARRDFTVNAMAIGEDGNVIDLFGGREDLATMTLRFVGDPMDRINEDSLRVLRGVRFAITRGFTPTPETLKAMGDATVPDMLATLPIERIRDELDKPMRQDTIATVRMLDELGLFDPIFSRKGFFLVPAQRP